MRGSGLVAGTLSVEHLLKLYGCFNDGLKICMCYFENPEIIFSCFFAF